MPMIEIVCVFERLCVLGVVVSFPLQRYHGHSSALKFANAQRELAEKRMAESQESQR